MFSQFSLTTKPFGRLKKNKPILIRLPWLTEHTYSLFLLVRVINTVDTSRPSDLGWPHCRGSYSGERGTGGGRLVSFGQKRKRSFWTEVVNVRPRSHVYLWVYRIQICRFSIFRSILWYYILYEIGERNFLYISLPGSYSSNLYLKKLSLKVDEQGHRGKRQTRVEVGSRV